MTLRSDEEAEARLPDRVVRSILEERGRRIQIDGDGSEDPCHAGGGSGLRSTRCGSRAGSLLRSFNPRHEQLERLLNSKRVLSSG